MSDNPRIGVALGSGGARGFAHVGVLRVLEEAGIRPQLITGSSMGALIAGVYATGAPVAMMERVATTLPLGRWLDPAVPRMGLFNGARIHELIKVLTKNRTFEEAVVPLAIVATDLERGERVTFREGPIHDAVRASISIPGLFKPHRVDGRLLVDGGVIDRVPIDAARELGADFVIAVDVGLFDKLPPIKNIWDVLIQSMDIMEREVFRYRIESADFVVRPQLDFLSSTSLKVAPQAVQRGRAAMEAALPRLRDALAAFALTQRNAHA
jgi:NTE family protein